MVREARSDTEVGPHSPHAPRDVDRGFTLVELVMAITVMMIIAVPTMSAVIAAIRADVLNNDLADVQTVLQNAVDNVNRTLPKNCDYTQYAQNAATNEGWNGPATVTVVQQHYTPGATPDVPGAWSTGACIGASTTPAPQLVQMVTITVKSPDGKVQKTLQVVKSDV
jgi:prepilin-type N-terminal cleavage/methylation domain-containing protein